jgi:hypothetical protein
MHKVYCVAFIGLIELFGSPRLYCRAQEPAKGKERDEIPPGLALKRVPKAKVPDDGFPGWSGKYLRAMKEPSLCSLAEKDRAAITYRFVWLPSFHDQISVRFVKSDRGILMHVVRLKLDAEFEPLRIVMRKRAQLNPRSWERIARHLERADFWTTPTNKPPPFGVLIQDGDLLIVEGVTDGRHHSVIRHSPPGGNFVDLCHAMLFMSGLDNRTRRVWFEYRD